MKSHNLTCPLSILLIIILAYSVSARPLNYRNFEANADERVPFDAYFNLESQKLKRERVMHLVKTMIARPNEIAYIVSYGNIRLIDCDAIENLKLVERIIRKQKEIASARVIYVNGGYRSRGMTELYLVPNSASFVFPKFEINEILNPKEPAKH